MRALLRLLEERGHVKHTQDGVRYVYAPATPRSDARRSALAHVVRTFFDGSVEDAVATLVETSRVDAVPGVSREPSGRVLLSDEIR